jgi:hypothetical protein
VVSSAIQPLFVRFAEGIVLAFDSGWEGTVMTKKGQSLTDLIEQAVDKGATTAEEIHKSIAEFPLKLMEGSELLRQPAKGVRRLQDQTIGAFYDLVRDTNRRVARLTSDLLRGRGKRSTHTPRAA